MASPSAATDAMRPDYNRARLGMSKLEWLIAAVVILLLVALSYEAFTAAEAAKYERRANESFRATMLGIYNFYDAHGCLPVPVLVDDAGNPKASWRLQVILYVDANKTYLPDMNRPWILPDKTELDLKAFAQVPNIFSFWEKTDFGTTRIAAVTGPDTAFDEAHRCSAFRELDDDTIMLVEVADPQVLWTEPGDFDWTGDLATANQPGAMRIGAKRDTRGFHVAFKDGTVWLLSRDTPLSELSRFFTAQGARDNNRESVLGRYRL